MSEEVLERQLFSSFDKYEEFVGTEEAFLAVDLFKDPSTEDNQKEQVLFLRLSAIVRFRIIHILPLSQRQAARYISGTILSARPFPRKTGRPGSGMPTVIRKKIYYRSKSTGLASQG
jgi:hypothetical protein